MLPKKIFGNVSQLKVITIERQNLAGLSDRGSAVAFGLERKNPTRN
jgi:hypothetical protein